MALSLRTASRIFRTPEARRILAARSVSLRSAGSQQSGGSGQSGGSSFAFLASAGALAAGAAASSCFWGFGEKKEAKPDYEKVYAEIAAKLDNLDYDDGSYGPLLIRLAWHASGTYSIKDGSGGSNGSTMRFPSEASWGANAGLKIARDLLAPIAAANPGVSTADIWTLAGVAAVQQLGGPTIPWRPGRVDYKDDSKVVPDGRLPDASKSQGHLRDIFYRMGFNDQEIVALAGAHSLGRCHTDRSGFEGPWTRAPTTFSNDYFKRLLEDKWVERKWAGPRQFANAGTGGDLMMLPADLALTADPEFRKYVEIYAKDEARFRADFAAAFARLLELGVPFPAGSTPRAFKPVA